MTTPKSKKRFVVVTTEFKGVFGGYLNGDQDPEAKVLTLTEAQMCVHWSADVGGMAGLAAGGPTRNCRVSPAVPKVTLQAVTGVFEATEAAEKAWKGRPWS